MAFETLDGACELIVDCPHNTAPVVEDPFAFAVGTLAIAKDGTISLARARPVDQATYERWTARAVPRAGDLIFCREAPVGPVAIVPSDPKLCLGQRTMLLRPDRRRTDSRWLAYFLRAPTTLTALLSRSEGSTVAHLNVSDVRSFGLRLPPLREQRAIASVLGALDDKIESNRRLISAQREVRATRYRHMVAAPDGRHGLDSIASIVKGTVQPALMPEAVFEQFSIPAFDEGEDPEVCFGAAMASGKTPLPASPVVLFSKLNPGTPRVWSPAPSGVGIAVCSPEFVVLAARDDTSHAWLESCVRSDSRFYDEVMSAVAGTTGSRQRVKPADVLRATVPQIGPDALSEWAAFVSPLIAREAALSRERRTLAAIRDALLPKLVSGQIRVPLSDDLAESFGVAIEALNGAAS